MKSPFSAICVSLALLPSALAYLEPAKLSPVAEPDFLSYTPSLSAHGNFANRNTSVKPWAAIPPTTTNFQSKAVSLAKSGGCPVKNPKTRQSFWVPNVPHEGTSPFLNEGSKYKVYRNVKHYGAKGDGVTDDTIAIQNAISAGGRIPGGAGQGGTTGQPALVYIPPGNYVVSGTIQLYVDTQIIGDAVDMPVLKASSSFSHNYILNGLDPGEGSTTEFFIGVRNIEIDTTSVNVNKTVYQLNWAVSQATNLVNNHFNMPSYSQHVGITMNGGGGGGGSGTHMADNTFTGGLVGLQLNNQQYAFKNMTFNGCNTGIQLQHIFVANFQHMTFMNCGIAVDFTTADDSGSISLIDSSATNVGIVVNGAASTLLENIQNTNSGPTLLVNGNTLVSGSLIKQTYVYGHVYTNTTGPDVVTTGMYLPYTDRGEMTDANGDYLYKAQPTYTEYSAKAFVSMKDVGAMGDGQTDDTAAINAALAANAGCKITYFPHGVYVVTDTIYVPPGSRIVGEVWSEITASGSKFNSSANPHVMFMVGKPGDVGVAEIQDMVFTTADVLEGAIVVQVNMKGTNKGDVSFHNSHWRIGGAAGSRVETACQTSGQPCKAAFLLLHVAKTGQAYVENAWLWSADHDLDGNYNQVIGTGRGVLVEATAGTWLVGTGSEHHILYAYTLSSAQNVYISMAQVETPYFQPVPQAPYPWTPNATWHDPDFSACNLANGSAGDPKCYMQWGMRIIGDGTKNIAVYGTGTWVFFNNYGGCADGYCQLNGYELGPELEVGDEVYVYNLNTLNVQQMVRLGGSNGTAPVPQDSNRGSWGAVIAAFLGYV